MSTKLYNGLKVSDPDLDIFDVVEQVSKEIENTATEISLKHVLTTMTSIYLDPAIIKRSGIKESTSMRWNVTQLFEQEQGERSPSDDLHDPFRFNIVFGKTSSGQILAYPFCFQHRYRDTLENMDIFTEYGFWDNVDRPEDVSRAEWQQRKDDWDFVCGDYGNLSHLPSWTLGTMRAGTVINPMDILMDKWLAQKTLRSEKDQISDITLSEAERMDVLFLRVESQVYQKIDKEDFSLDPDLLPTVHRLIENTVKENLSQQDHLHLVPVLTWGDLTSGIPTDPVDLSEVDWVVNATVDKVKSTI